MNPETRIQNKISNYLRQNGILYWRIHNNPSMTGFPDILVCYKGVFIGLEVKTETGRPTLQQEKVMNDIELYGGGIARVVRSIEDVERILDEAKDRTEALPKSNSR